MVWLLSVELYNNQCARPSRTMSRCLCTNYRREKLAFLTGGRLNQEWRGGCSRSL
jgi:hypothetical protein